MNIYLETSAVLRDLLDGEDKHEIRQWLRGAKFIATSQLTIAEVGRVLARVRVLEPQVASIIAARAAQFETDSELWVIHPVDDAIWSRCARPFPKEPLRTLDAIHLATIEILSAAIDNLAILSTDIRVRENAKILGFKALP
ncbi:MAG: type II toxin-antitoxin system VapC family toxin [Deltaproteobacteria bacterium]|nr:type II toxin-antitoxin system VapC family toxin [Deltaproteobacteria bacterium]